MIPGERRTCPHCGAPLAGTVVEIERGGVRIEVLDIGDRYVMSERSLCKKCGVGEVHFDTSLKQLVRLLRMVTGELILESELDVSVETKGDKDERYR